MLKHWKKKNVRENNRKSITILKQDKQIDSNWHNRIRLSELINLKNFLDEHALSVTSRYPPEQSNALRFPQFSCPVHFIPGIFSAVQLRTVNKHTQRWTLVALASSRICCRNNRILSPHRQWLESPFFFVLDFKGSSGSSLNVSSSLVPRSVKPCSETPVYPTGQKLEMVKTDSTIIKAPLFNWYCQSAVSIWTQNNSFSINECSSLHGRVSVSTYNARSGDCFPFFGFVSLFSIWTPVLSSHIQHAFVTFVTLLR